MTLLGRERLWLWGLSRIPETNILSQTCSAVRRLWEISEKLVRNLWETCENCRGTSKCLQSCWGLERRVLVSWKCHAVAWHHGLNEIWWQACKWFGFTLRWCSWSCMLAPGKSMQADLHAARFPYVLIIYSLPVVLLQCFVPLPAAVSYSAGLFLRACFFLRFEVQKRAPSFSYCFAPISIALRPSRPASKPALTCFVLISMVVRHWSSRLALRSASNFVSSYNSFGLLQFP